MSPKQKEVWRVATICVKHKAPMTVRGKDTANYGLSIIFKGGVILDTKGIVDIPWI